MAISFISAGTVATDIGSTAVPMPGTYAAGDLLVLCSINTSGPTTPSGWTLLSAEGSGRYITVFYKFASASESSVTLNTSAKAVVLAYRGVRTSTPTDGTSTFSGNNGAVSSLATNTFSTTLSNDYIVSVFGTAAVSGTPKTFTAPASTTTRANSNGTSLAGALLVVDELFSSSGTTTSRTATLSAAGAVSAFAFALAPEGVPKYWVGGSGTWDTTTTTNWSNTSGGPGGASVPTAIDTVYFDQAGTYTVTCTGALACLDLNVTAGSVTFAQGTSPTFAISGSMSLIAGTVWSATGTITFNSASTGKTITTNGTTISGAVTFNGVGGSWTLGSALTSSSSITLTNGSFNASTYDVTCTTFSSSNSNARTLSLGSGTWTLSGTGTVWDTSTTTGLTFNKNTANIVLSNTTTTARTFAGGGRTYNKLTIGGTTGTSTLTFTGSSTFSELASTKTVAHTITFTGGTTTTVTTWSITGTSGNVVTLNSDVAGTAYTLAKAGGGYLTGIDYLNVRDAIGSPISDTWYIGENSVINTTAPNQGYALFTTQRANNAVVVLTSTTSASWVVPSDWNSYNNSIHLIGGGGGGAGSRFVSPNAAGGGGGGGAGYTKLINQTLSGSITYQAGTAGGGGAAGVDGTAGGTTSWNSGASTAGGGGGGQATTTPTSTGGTAGTGSTFNGGAGGVGSTSTVVSTGNGGGGGGGAGGPNGNGGNGGNGFGSTTQASVAGGGGGGNGGGTGAGDASAGVGGTGGNNSAGVGGGASATAGAVGGGGGGLLNGGVTISGGPGSDIFGIGSGGGGGGLPNAIATYTGGMFGAGGGGAGNPTAGTTRAGSAGAQGAIIITYEPNIPRHRIANTGNLLTNTYLNEVNASSVKFQYDSVIGRLDEVSANYYYSNYFDGNGDWLTAPSSAAFAFGTGDFTIEFWVNFTSTANRQDIIWVNVSASDRLGIIYNISANNITYYISPTVANAINGPFTPTAGVWYHIALTRASGSSRLFINGTQGGSTYADSRNYNTAAYEVFIGRDSAAASSYLNGYISNARIVKGTAVYTASFTPPTSPLTTITNTSLLTCQSSTFKDNGPNDFTITATGNSTVSNFNPFATPFQAMRISNNSSILVKGYFDEVNKFYS